MATDCESNDIRALLFLYEEDGGAFAPHLESCEACRNWLQELRAVSAALDLDPLPQLDAERWSLFREQLSAMTSWIPVDPVPLPEPARFEQLKSEVLSAVSLAPRPAPILRFPVALRIAAALLLFVLGGLAATAILTRNPSVPELTAKNQAAAEAIARRDLKRAEALLRGVVEGGGARHECRELVRSAGRELDALRSFRALAQDAPRQEALGGFLYRYPGSQIASLVLHEYDASRLPAKTPKQRKGLSMDDFRAEAPPIPGALVTIDRFRKLIQRKEPWLRDAARLQLAMTLERNGDVAGALVELEAIEGRSPAARFAQECTERLKANAE